MNRFSIYVLLLLSYLGLSKSFAPSEKATPFIRNSWDLGQLNKSGPVSLILLDYFEAGFIIRTYFQKYLEIGPYSQPVTKIVRVSKDFYTENRNNLGLSLLRKAENSDQIETLPLPPGSLYIGDPGFGHWIGSGKKKKWRFHRAYRHFPRLFSWGKFRPGQQFYSSLILHQKTNQPFYGINNEFGTQGHITKKYLSPNVENTYGPTSRWKEVLKKYVSFPPWEKTENKNDRAF